MVWVNFLFHCCGWMLDDMKRNAEKNSVIKRVWSIIWQMIAWMVFGVAIVLFGGLDFLGPYQQSSSSTFVEVTNVKIASFDWYSDHHGTGDSDVKVNFTYRGHRYKKIAVIDSAPLSFFFVHYADPAVWHQRGYSYKKYTGYPSIDTPIAPPLKDLLTYNHEKRIPKGTYAVQVNKWTPSLKRQIHDGELCLVTN